MTWFCASGYKRAWLACKISHSPRRRPLRTVAEQVHNSTQYSKFMLIFDSFLCQSVVTCLCVQLFNLDCFFYRGSYNRWLVPFHRTSSCSCATSANTPAYFVLKITFSIMVFTYMFNVLTRKRYISSEDVSGRSCAKSTRLLVQGLTTSQQRNNRAIYLIQVGLRQT